MIDFITTPHFRLIISIVAVGLLVWLLGKRFPRPARNVLRELDRWSGFVVILLGLLVLLCGIVGFGSLEQDKLMQGDSEGRTEQGQVTKKTETMSVALYETFQVFAFNANPTQMDKSSMLRVSMICAVLLAATVAAKGIALLFHESYVQMQLRLSSGHVVVLGLGRIGRQLIADLIDLKDSRAILVVEPNPENPNLAWARDNGAIVVIGDATKRDILEAAQVHKADEVFVVTGSDECNIESVIETRDILHQMGRQNWLGRPRAALRCHVHVLDRDLAEILRRKLKELEHVERLDIEVFNALERTARRLLEDIANLNFKGQPIRPSASHEFAHIILLGFGEFGQTLALKLAELAHFENGKRMRMTIVDRNIATMAKSFAARHPQFGPEIGQIPDWHFDKAADDWDSTVYRPVESCQLPQRSAGVESRGIEYVCNAQYIEYIEATDPEFLNGLNSCCRENGAKPVILVCFEDDRQNFAIAERLREKLERNESHWPIFVWIPRQRELSQLLVDKRVADKRSVEKSDKVPDGRPCELIPFGQCYGSVSYSEVTGSWSEWLARYLQLVWMSEEQSGWAPCVAELQEAIMAEDQVSAMRALDWNKLELVAKNVWEECDEWERASNRSAAIHSVLKAATFGVRIENLGDMSDTPIEFNSPPELDELLRRMEHYRWVSERLIAGWRYDEQRSNIRKTRWQITPWNGLDHPPQSVIDHANAGGKMGNEKLKDERIVKLLIGLLKSGRLKALGLR